MEPVMTAVLVLTITSDQYLSSNQRLHWKPKSDRTRAIRDMAAVWCRHYRFTKMQVATCHVEITWPDRRVRDAHNAQPSIKAALDGAIGDYGLLPSDSDKHLKSLTITASKEVRKTPGVAAYLTFTFTPVTGELP